MLGEAGHPLGQPRFLSGKNIIISLLLIHCSLIIANAQWVNVSGNFVSGNNISSIISNNNELFVGSNILTNKINRGIGVYRSTNNGNNWTQTSLIASTLNLLARNSRIFAVTDYQGSYYSDNNGTNWVLMNFPSAYTLCSNDTYIFASTSSGIYKSSDNGISWQSTSLSVSGGCLLSKGNYIFSGSGSTLYISSNNGVNWIQTSTVFMIGSLATNGNEIFAGSPNNGIYKSTNNGFNWSQTSMTSNYIDALLAIGDVIIAGDGMGNGIYISTNSGANWIQRNEGFGSSTHVNDLLYANEYIFAGNANGIWRRSFQQLVSIQNLSNMIPEYYSLQQNYPNPFNPTTKIKFTVANGFPIRTFGNDKVVLKVLDVLGREVATLVNEKLNPGTYEVTFDGSNYPSGVYFYQLRNENFIETKKLILLK
jgi:hypothetical protein